MAVGALNLHSGSLLSLFTLATALAVSWPQGIEILRFLPRWLWGSLSLPLCADLLWGPHIQATKDTGLAGSVPLRGTGCLRVLGKDTYLLRDNQGITITL